MWSMSLRDLRGKYSGSMLGLWWAVVTPWLLALSISFVFANAFGVRTKNFSLFVLSGILPWFFFSNALSEAACSFAVRAPEARQNIFPREFIPLACVLSHFLNFLIGLGVLCPFFLIAAPKVAIVIGLLPVLLICYLLFVFGAALLMACANIFIKDVSCLLSVFLMAWFWMTPVFYDAETMAPSYRWICLLNPMTPFVTAFRMLLFEAAAPSLSLFFSIILLAVFSCFAGFGVFYKNEAKILKRI